MTPSGKENKLKNKTENVNKSFYLQHNPFIGGLLMSLTQFTAKIFQDTKYNRTQ